MEIATLERLTLMAAIVVVMLSAILDLAVRLGWLKTWVTLAIRLFPWLSYDYRARRIHRRQKCVACGAGGKKDLRFDPVQKVVIVQCPICLAAWGYNPVVNAGKWAAPIVEK